MDNWIVTYSLQDAFYTENVRMLATLDYIDAAKGAMKKIKESNPSAKNIHATKA